VRFEGGKTWRWLDLKPGTITVTLSPGGGAKNNGLRRIGGTFSDFESSSCSNSAGPDPYNRLSFKADGRTIDYLSPRYSLLPDHVDLITLEITTPPLPERCVIGLSWENPSVLRDGPIP
jgi:hypothetical protein